ncbi:MAG: hypothetical protein OFPII_00140 [Osedax symbiont Rs1]|nr:MAG: hypothetical protein OFPII_00140 [Osedax symbiont Rs1]
MDDLKVTPQAKQSWLLDLVIGPVRWSLLNVALELRLFDYLQSADTAASLAKKLDLKPVKTAVLLDALTSLGVLAKKHGQYKVVASLKMFLQSDSKQSMRDMLLHLAKVKHSDASSILQVLKTGKSSHVSANYAQPEFWDKAVDNLRSFHASCSNQVAINILQNLPQWPNVKTFMDVGAGSEYLAANLAENYPDLAIRVFDLAPCAKRIETALTPLQHRQIEVLAGDYNLDEIKPENDLIWASMSLYYAKDLNLVLGKIHAALTSSGILVCLHEGLQAERTLPEHHVVGRFVPAMNGMDVSFSHGVLAKAMKTVGFSRIVSQSIDTVYGPMQLDIGYR